MFYNPFAIMKRFSPYFLLFMLISFVNCKHSNNFNTETLQNNDSIKAITVAQFKGQQVTGVSVSSSGRIFANFPRWRPHVKHAVVEVAENGTAIPYPNAQWNSWNTQQDAQDSVFVAVQSVIAHRNKLYVLDTRNPLWQGVIDAPRIYVFNLSDNSLDRILKLDASSYKANSYTNDLRIDDTNNAIFITDSNEGAIIVYDLNSNTSKRVLDQHPSVLAETDQLKFKNKTWKNTVHSDGIALNTSNNRLYYHSLTGYTLYSVPTSVLVNGSETEIANAVKKEAITGAPDGMIFDENQNLYLADLEQQKIDILSPNGKLSTFFKSDAVKWADTFSIYNGYLFYTNSRIDEVEGNISNMIFTINKIKL